MKKKAKRTSEAEVARYWLEHDSVPDVDWSAPGVRLEFDAKVERPTRSVTIRLPTRLVRELRVLAKDRDVPYQSLMKVLLAEKVAELRRKKASCRGAASR
jgi:predicted DNA binding CopG/RHH family protein